MAILIEVEQGSTEWHTLRQSGIGSSDAAVILWQDPFGKTPYSLWKLKTGRSAPKDWDPFGAKGHGRNTEEHARNQAAAFLGDFYAPAVLRCDIKGCEFMLASLDGANADLTEILEVKCPVEIGTHLQAREGRVDDHYYTQVQHQLYVTGAKLCHFFSWFACTACKGKGGDCESCRGLGGEGVMVAVPPDPDFWKTELLPAEKEFWSWVEKNEYPMPAGEAVIEDKNAIAAACAYAATIGQMRELEDQQRKLKAQLLRLAPGKKNVRVGPLEVVWNFRKGYTESKPRTVADSLSCTIHRVEG